MISAFEHYDTNFFKLIRQSQSLDERLARDVTGRSSAIFGQTNHIEAASWRRPALLMAFVAEQAISKQLAASVLHTSYSAPLHSVLRHPASAISILSVTSLFTIDEASFSAATFILKIFSASFLLL